MRIVNKLTNNRFLNIKEVIDPENNVNKYQFAERLGVDSVAFIGFDLDTNKYLVNNEYKPPVNKFITGAFGGSIDKDKSLKEIVIDEVREEAGFEVDKKNVIEVGKAFVSTQMNQFCYLFLVFLDKKMQKERRPENAIEAMATTTWLSEEDICQMNDWKAITIISMAKSKNII